MGGAAGFATLGPSFARWQAAWARPGGRFSFIRRRGDHMFASRATRTRNAVRRYKTGRDAEEGGTNGHRQQRSVGDPTEQRRGATGRSRAVAHWVRRHGLPSPPPPAAAAVPDASARVAAGGAAAAAAAAADVRADDGHGDGGAGVLRGEGRRRRWEGGGEEAAVHGGADTVAGVHVPCAPRQAGAPGEGGAGARAGPAAAPGRHLVPEQARAVALQAARARLRRPPRQLRRPPLPRRVPQARQARPRRTVAGAEREAEGEGRRQRWRWRWRDDRCRQQQQLQRRRQGAGRRQEERRRRAGAHRELRARRDGVRHAGGRLGVGGVRVRRPPPLRRGGLPGVLLRHAGAVGAVAVAARRVERGGLKPWIRT